MKSRYQPTGDAFTDVGAAILQQLLAQHPDWIEQQALKFATDFYMSRWKGNLYDFFNNSGITNPANKGKEEERTLAYYRALLEPADTVARGVCRVSGEYEPLFTAGRDNQILVGSGAALNFHHGLDRGLLVGGRSLLYNFFMPLGCLRVRDKVALVHSSQPIITALIAEINLAKNRSQAALETGTGLVRSDKGYPANALFAYVDDVLDKAEQVLLDADAPVPSLTLYHFTNRGKGPDLALYHLSAAVFEFYRSVMRDVYRKPWMRFVRAHYQRGKIFGATAADSDALWMPGKAKGEALAAVEPAVYQAWPNSVYLRLIQGQGLLKMMWKWSYKLWRYYPDEAPFPYELADFYCQHLLNMKKETLELIERLALYIALDPNESFINRTRRRLSTIRSAAELRLALAGLQRRNYEAEKPDALFTLDEYVRDLFPEGVSWREVRNLLLISLYEQLHKQGKHLEAQEEDLEAGAIADARKHEAEDDED